MPSQASPGPLCGEGYHVVHQAGSGAAVRRVSGDKRFQGANGPAPLAAAAQCATSGRRLDRTEAQAESAPA
ncbi:MAG: hypothetical protein ACPIOQ_12510 [Promethearchaeia archaeon]